MMASREMDPHTDPLYTSSAYQPAVWRSTTSRSFIPFSTVDTLMAYNAGKDSSTKNRRDDDGIISDSKMRVLKSMYNTTINKVGHNAMSADWRQSVKVEMEKRGIKSPRKVREELKEAGAKHEELFVESPDERKRRFRQTTQILDFPSHPIKAPPPMLMTVSIPNTICSRVHVFEKEGGTKNQVSSQIACLGGKTYDPPDQQFSDSSNDAATPATVQHESLQKALEKADRSSRLPPSNLVVGKLPPHKENATTKPPAGEVTKRYKAIIEAERSQDIIANPLVAQHKPGEIFEFSKEATTNSRAVLLDNYKRNNQLMFEKNSDPSPSTRVGISSGIERMEAKSVTVVGKKDENNGLRGNYVTTMMVTNNYVHTGRTEVPAIGAGAASHHYPQYDIVSGRPRNNPHYLPTDHHRNPVNSAPHGKVLLSSEFTHSGPIASHATATASASVTINTTTKMRDNINAKRTYMYCQPNADMLKRGPSQQYNIITNETLMYM